MSLASTRNRLTVPESLQRQLQQFRRQVWSTKMIESIALAVAGVLLAFLIVFAVDRFIDTPRSVRFGILLGVFALVAMLPWAFHRWVWSNRRMDQLARLLRKRDPHIGDQLLGVIELAESDREQARSRALCAAAMKQVAEAAQGRDLLLATPVSRHRMWLAIATLGVFAAFISAAVAPQAASNAFARLMTPWREIPRYTFTMIQPLSDRIVVPHGEPVDLPIALAAQSIWKPNSAFANLPYVEPVTARLVGDKYVLPLPALTGTTTMDLKVGDYFKRVTIEPKARPELASVNADVTLPGYLNLPEVQKRDARSGTVSVVSGSQVALTAKASRPLQSAQYNGTSVAVSNDSFEVPKLDVAAEPRQVALEWQDADMLAGREPFKINLQGRPDEAPSISIEGLPRQAVVLDSEQLNFKLFAGDDFGIKRAGIEWRGLDDTLVEKVAQGERALAVGGPDQSAMQMQAVFSAKDNGIEPQPIELRVWVEDYLPNRERVYSAPHRLYVLSPDQHAIWMTEQLSKWHRQSLDIRDREMQLHETNKQIREMPVAELDDPDTRKKIEAQAAGEAANGRRLGQLSKMGDELIRQASRNPEIGVGHLEKWAEMLQVLKDISGNRMPSVEDLLKQAASAPKLAGEPQPPSKSGPGVGKIRDTASAQGAAPKAGEPAPPKPAIPSIADRESSQQPIEESNDPAAPSKGSKQGRLTLPSTTIAGPPQKSEEKPEDTQQAVVEAVKEQADLLAEFEKIADELNNVLANLEGSTLVKRLKAASREQIQVAGKLSDRIEATFGKGSQIDEPSKKVITDMVQVEQKSVQNISFIMDDMQAYFERRRMNQFKLVLDEMRETDVLSAIRVLGEEIPKEQGMSIAQCEYWSDTLDRWADDLVDPACKGSCPGGKSKDSLPPSIILEVLQILEGEVNLREETRVAEQAKPAVTEEQHTDEGDRLSEKQEQLQIRIQKVVDRILDLPDPEVNFGKELELLNAVDLVMGEATIILCVPDTGTAAIAAETEAIELLLKSRRINPKGGGGGGTSPGGGGSGTTNDSALALVGTGINEKEQREHRDVQQATGETGTQLPEEYRSGLDEYFNRLDGEQR